MLQIVLHSRGVQTSNVNIVVNIRKGLINSKYETFKTPGIIHLNFKSKQFHLSTTIHDFFFTPDGDQNSDIKNT